MFLFPARGDVSSPRAVVEIARKQWIERTTLDSKYFSPCDCRNHPHAMDRESSVFLYKNSCHKVKGRSALRRQPEPSTRERLPRAPTSRWAPLALVGRTPLC
ncbi:hypothetical protein GW17_00059445 [Ensete ventricosum]|nr:hypothetical protein GW17_00059445 [Ensete ventricosum]